MKRSIAWVAAWTLTLLTLISASIRFLPDPPPFKPIWAINLFATEMGPLLAVLVIFSVAFVRNWRDRALPFLAGAACLLSLLPIYETISSQKTWMQSLRPGSIVQENESLFSIQDFLRPPRKVTPSSEFITTRDGAVLPIYVYRPLIASAAGTPVKPWILSIHGSTFGNGSPEDLSSSVLPLLREGYTVIAPSYRFPPTLIWPKQLEDIQDAFEWISQNADRLNVDMNKFWVQGRGLGGQIALKFAYAAERPEGLRGVIALYSMTDLEFGFAVGENEGALSSRRKLESLVGSTPSLSPHLYQEASPLENVPENPPRTLLISGRSDPLGSSMHAERLRARVQEKGGKAFVIDLPWATYGFDYFSSSVGGQVAARASLFFLKLP
jgi:acetyl esterase/lipase